MIAEDYARMLNRIYQGNDDEYASIEEYVDSLGYSPRSWMPDVIRGWDGTKKGVILMLAGGGPTVWLDTEAVCVICPSDNSCCGTFRDICDEINYLFGIED